ncbi:UNVERIFIED_CONTAM: WAT1-related protein [Sesamum calycinum]|uniref:WAT1-related protein n=1 Tax=Sesamum calycinum TaxID=2727403 RepID=A0AAW2R7Q4_9LAMI
MDAAGAKICNNLHGLKPTLIMVMVQAIFAVVNVGYKLAANDGMRLPILEKEAEVDMEDRVLWLSLWFVRVRTTGSTLLQVSKGSWYRKRMGERCSTLYKGLGHYPCPYSITAMITVWGSIQSVTVALCMERDWSNWKLGWDIRLLTVAFAGIVGSGLMFTLVAWCVRMRGPLFVSIFNPLMLVIVAIAGSLFLEEKLHLGMVLGAILIVGGLYVVLWGKGKELKKVSQLMPENQEHQVADMPLPRRSGGSSHGGSKREVEAEVEVEEEERRQKGFSC